MMCYPLKFGIEIFKHFPKGAIMSMSSRFFWLNVCDDLIKRINELPYNFGQFKKELPNIEKAREMIKDSEVVYE